MSLEEDDLVSCYWDAESRADDAFELEMDGMPGVWPRDWSSSYSGNANLSRDLQSQFYSTSTTTHARKELDTSNISFRTLRSRKESIQTVNELDAPADSEQPSELQVGKRDRTDERHLASEDAQRDSRPAAKIQRPATSGGEHARAIQDGAMMSQQYAHVRQGRSRTLSSRNDVDGSRAQRARYGSDEPTLRGPKSLRSEDLFLELANDQAAVEQAGRPVSYGEATPGRISAGGKRRSLPVENGVPPSSDRRPKSSGHLLCNKPTSRIGSSLDFQRHLDRNGSTPSRALLPADDAVSLSSVSRSGASRRQAAAPERASSLAEQLRSSELPQFGRRRPSFGASPRQGPNPRPSQLATELQDSHSDSPADDSDRKHSLPDSTSAESETADTVWDELDDLKSRIKKLELTGKLPQTSTAAYTTEQNERPRTATTAPTTIDSSPKHEKPEKQEKKADHVVQSPSPDLAGEYVVGGPDAANCHPNLHSALATAKTILSPSLYRSLEASASDALQLAAMTGSAGPQGTALTAAAIINGVTVSDRHMRRKVDQMCRNLTDLVLALCEGKTETTNSVSSPITINNSALASPTFRSSRPSLSPSGGASRSTTRPLSRLEARRASILGSQQGSNLGTSPVESGEDASASEYESTRSYPKIQGLRDLVRSGSRLQAARQRRHEETDQDEDPTIRPPSRAMTDIGRAKPSVSKEYSTPIRSPSLRESLAARRVNTASHESNRELSRIAPSSSDSGRRRFLDPMTPPVLEEEGSSEDNGSTSQPKRRITSYGAFSARRSAVNAPNRSTSLYQSRSVDGE